MREVLPALVAIVLLVPTPAAQQSTVDKPKVEKLQGYAEWRRGHDVIVDGQRVVANRSTKFKGTNVRTLDDIVLGSELDVKGSRLPDGRVLAQEVEARPNGEALFEDEVRKATDEMEAKWLAGGAVTEPTSDGKEKLIGKTVDAGSDVDRARAILARVTPPYVDKAAIRLHVIETKDWNAMAMGNGALWVFTGLLRDMNDDEVAIVVGHELAHYTHEHTRRSFKKAIWAQLMLVGVAVAASEVGGEKKQVAVTLAGLFSISAWMNGYGRDLEDQADRVGLRYAYEAGYDVRRGPALWQRFKDKYGDQNRVVNFFLGDHSVARTRIRNLDREIALNYSGRQLQ